jgi:hypothetical protein
MPRGKPNTPAANEQKLIDKTDEQLIHDMTLKQAEIKIAKSNAGRVRKRVQDLSRQRDAMFEELISRDAIRHNLPLPFGKASEDDDEEGDDD